MSIQRKCPLWWIGKSLVTGKSCVVFLGSLVIIGDLSRIFLQFRLHCMLCLKVSPPRRRVSDWLTYLNIVGQQYIKVVLKN